MKHTIFKEKQRKRRRGGGGGEEEKEADDEENSFRSGGFDITFVAWSFLSLCLCEDERPNFEDGGFFSSRLC
jgi:hypothetical protein